MHWRGFGRGVLPFLLTLLLLVVECPGVQSAPPPAQPVNITAFFDGLVGEWIGSYAQSNGKTQAPTKYFHAVVKATGLTTYESVFEYYRINEDTRKTELVGSSRMATTIAPDGTATNVITGNGAVLINKQENPESHQFSETLRMTSVGILQGLGTGSIDVNGSSGKVTNYASTWSMHAGSFRITQQIKVRFRVLFFSQVYNINTDFTGSRGSDIMGLINASEGHANHADGTTGH